MQFQISKSSGSVHALLAKGRQGEAAENYCCYFEKRKSVKGLVINEKKVTFVYIFDEQTAVKCKLNCKIQEFQFSRLQYSEKLKQRKAREE